jgi:ubiquinone/menaquinone biosynthesis C-methylase UbiE
LHSYIDGNCNWEAAFDVKSAFELVHMHHFPHLSPADCMAELHRRLDDATLREVQCGPIKTVVDMGCGAGTSTFSLRQSLDRHGATDAKVTGVDLSSHFVTMGKYRQFQWDQRGDGAKPKWGEERLEFKHGDALQLRRLGYPDESCEVVMHAKVSHEAPKHVNYMLMAEAARVLKPGGTVGYVDINPHQILKTNPVSNLAQRVAISNEPFFDSFLETDMYDCFRQAGLEVILEAASNPEKWPILEDAPVRVLVARKPLKSK